MVAENNLKFPQFDCVISNTMEDYDAEVEMFFLTKNIVASQISRLRFTDKEWASNYEEMIQYIHDLTVSLVEFKDTPSHQFLIELSLGDELEDDTIQRLKASTSPVVADLVEVSTRVREMMYWYVRNGKNEKFSKSFTPEKFQGLPFLRLVLTYRSIRLNNSK